MKIQLPESFIYTNRAKNSSAHVKDGILYVSGCVSFEDLMYTLTYVVKGYDKCYYCGCELTEKTRTLDHIYPIAKGGQDHKDNWVTTSMKNNSIKSNYTIDEIHWKLYPKGNISDWDGLTKVLVKLVQNENELLKDSYIRTWFKVSFNAFNQLGLL